MNKISRDKDDALTHKRSQHDLENQTMEANLDIVLDRLRQSSSTEVIHVYIIHNKNILYTILYCIVLYCIESYILHIRIVLL